MSKMLSKQIVLLQYTIDKWIATSSIGKFDFWNDFWNSKNTKLETYSKLKCFTSIPTITFSV